MAAGQEVYSIDESFLDVTGIDNLIPFEAFGQQMRDRFRKETVLLIGVGIGQTKTLAKLANHASKKWKQTNGVVDLSDRSWQRKLLHLTDVSDIWGIGRRISLRMNQLENTTALQLVDSNVKMIRKNFDVIVDRTARKLNGESCLALEDAPPRIIKHMQCPFFAHTERTKPFLSMFAVHLHPLPNRGRTCDFKFRSSLRLGNLPRQHSLHGFKSDMGVD